MRWENNSIKWYKKIRFSRMLEWCILGMIVLSLFVRMSDGGLTGKTILLVIFCVVMAFSINLLLKARDKRMEQQNRYLALQKELLEEHYAALQNHMEIVRKFREDIANQMNILDQVVMKADGKVFVEQYINDLKQQWNELKKIDYCDDIVIDAMIYNKAVLCQEKGIKANFDFQGFAKGNLDVVDILGVLNNVIDRAITYCLQDAAVVVPEIRMQCGRIKNCLLVKVHCNIAEAFSPSWEREGEYAVIRNIIYQYAGKIDMQVEAEGSSISVLFNDK